MSFSSRRKLPARRATPDPGTITRLEPQRDDPERMNLYLDGEFAFGLPMESVQVEGLQTGMELDAAAIERLLTIDEQSRAVSAALAFLGYRPRTRQEVSKRLRDRGYSPPAIEFAVQRVADWGYINDEDFARRWVEQRVEHHPRGPRLIEQELRQKGVDRETARAALDETEFDETAAATEAARDRLRKLADEDPLVAKRRVAGYLARRGYSSSTIRAALEAATGEEIDTSDEDNGPED